MGDISELRGLIIVITFLGVFTVMALLIPSQFFVYSSENKQAEIPTEFDAVDLPAFGSTYNITFGEWIFLHNWGESEFGYKMRFYATQGDHRLSNTHFYGIFGSHLMDWTSENGSSRGDYLYATEIVSDWDTETNLAEYTVKCDHFKMYAWISYNTTAYESLVEAWDDEQAKVLFCIDFDQKGTGWNAWNIIGALLLFELPNVHPIINVLLNIPLYACIAYLAFIFVLRALGAIFGGGGA